MLELYQKPLSMIPIKKLKNTKKIEDLADGIFKLKVAGKSSLALEIKSDNIIYKLYELTYDEVKVIDPEFELSEEEYNNLEIE